MIIGEQEKDTDTETAEEKTRSGGEYDNTINNITLNLNLRTTLLPPFHTSPFSILSSSSLPFSSRRAIPRHRKREETRLQENDAQTHARTELNMIMRERSTLY